MIKTILHSKNSSGVSLIEMLLYLTLFSMVMVGLVRSVNNIIYNLEKSNIATYADSDGVFIKGKLDWALGSSTSANITSTSLTAAIGGVNYVFTYATSTKSLMLKKGNLGTETLNSPIAPVGSMTFLKYGTNSQVYIGLSINGIVYDLNRTLP